MLLRLLLRLSTLLQPYQTYRDFAGYCSGMEFRNVQRQILGADIVEAADNAALADRPKAFNCVGVDCADNVLLVA